MSVRMHVKWQSMKHFCNVFLMDEVNAFDLCFAYFSLRRARKAIDPEFKW